MPNNDDKYRWILAYGAIAVWVFFALVFAAILIYGGVA